MVIYFDNRHAEPLEQLLRSLLYGTVSPEQQQEAARVALSAIAIEKECAPYQLWLKSHSTQEKTP